MASQLYSATRQRHAQVARLLDQLGLARVGGPTAVALVVLYVTGLIVLDARPTQACPSSSTPASPIRSRPPRHHASAER